MLHLRFEVRDKNGEMFNDSQGLPQPVLKTTLDVGYKATQAIEAECKEVCRFLEAVSGSTNINVSVMEHNSISGTYMNMHSYYWNEKRFVNHK